MEVFLERLSFFCEKKAASRFRDAALFLMLSNLIYQKV